MFSTPPIDLTATLRKGQRGVDYSQAKDYQRDGWNARTLQLYSHAGTHMDAQRHFEAGEGTIDTLTLDRCMGPAHVVDLREVVTEKMLILPSHLGELQETLAVDDSLLLLTGWSAFVEDDRIFRLSLPRVSEELAQWCVERQVKMLGVEPPSIADVANLPEVQKIHKILLGGNVTIVEGLCHLEQLCEKVLFAAFPLKVHQGDGAPCRAMAWTMPA